MGKFGSISIKSGPYSENAKLCSPPCISAES